MKAPLKKHIRSRLGTSDNPDEASWRADEGVVISENQAKNVLALIDAVDGLMNELPREEMYPDTWLKYYDIKELLEDMEK